jgi:hypothetical protein
MWHISVKSMPRGEEEAESFGRYVMALVPHPLYAPDLASCDLFFFPRRKSHPPYSR